MKWSEVRSMYPDSFVKFQVVDSHIENDKEIVDEISLIKVINDGKEAMKEHMKCKQGQYIYSTSKEVLEIQIVKYIGIRGNI